MISVPALPYCESSCNFKPRLLTISALSQIVKPRSVSPIYRLLYDTLSRPFDTALLHISEVAAVIYGNKCWSAIHSLQYRQLGVDFQRDIHNIIPPFNFTFQIFCFNFDQFTTQMDT